MKVLFDGLCITQQRTGIGNYAYELLKHFCNVPLMDVTAILQKPKGQFRDLEELYENRIIYSFKESKYLPFQMPGFKKFDILHAPNYIPAIFSGKTVVTIHDLSYIIFPEYHIKKVLWILEHYKDRMYNADAIITDSNSVKCEIIDLLHIDDALINVVNLGASDKFYPYKKSEISILEKFCLPKRYILYFGTIEPRKNIINLIKAFNEFKNASKSELKLVLAGGNGWLSENVSELIEKLYLKKDIILTGFFPQEYLPALINGARAVIYPSVYEGFGLPVLEAMSCAKPVLISNISSLPEVGGEAAVYFDPYDIMDIADKMLCTLENQQLMEILSKKSLVQSKRFSWERCAKETVDVYRKLF